MLGSKQNLFLPKSRNSFQLHFGTHKWSSLICSGFEGLLVRLAKGEFTEALKPEGGGRWRSKWTLPSAVLGTKKRGRLGKWRALRLSQSPSLADSLVLSGSNWIPSNVPVSSATTNLWQRWVIGEKSWQSGSRRSQYTWQLHHFSWGTDAVQWQVDSCSNRY